MAERAPQGGQRITTKRGRCATWHRASSPPPDTVLYVARGTCPDGSPSPPDVSGCSIDGFDQWVQAAQNNATARFSGHAAVRITETQ
jgi:hypothetical protein